MDKVKETAEFFRYGLLLGLHSVADVMTWMDATLLAESTPDIALIEASLSGSCGAVAVADWLGKVPGTFEESAVARRLLSTMLTLLKQQQVPTSVVAHWLYQMAVAQYLPEPEAEGDMWYFDDAVILAADGIYGNIEEIHQELIRFLSRYRLVE